MNSIEALLMWARSLQVWLGDQGITLQYGESPSDRLTRSCWLNVRRDDREAEVLLWESGEAEFNFKGQQAVVTQEHHEFGQVSDLAVVLATARYLTPDPLGLTPAPNPHTYVPNPYVLADPLGLDPAGPSPQMKQGHRAR